MIEIIGQRALSRYCRTVSGFCAQPDANYLPGPMTSTSQSRANQGALRLRTGDTVEGPDPFAPKDGERYFALLKVNTINFEDPEKARTRFISTI